jgi:hypothetical protein
MAAALVAAESTDSPVISAPARLIGLMVAFLNVDAALREKAGHDPVPPFEAIRQTIEAMEATGEFEDFDPAILARIVSGAKSPADDVLIDAVAMPDLPDNFADPQQSEDTLIDRIDASSSTIRNI